MRSLVLARPGAPSLARVFATAMAGAERGLKLLEVVGEALRSAERAGVHQLRLEPRRLFIADRETANPTVSLIDCGEPWSAADEGTENLGQGFARLVARLVMGVTEEGTGWPANSIPDLVPRLSSSVAEL